MESKIRQILNKVGCTMKKFFLHKIIRPIIALCVSAHFLTGFILGSWIAAITSHDGRLVDGALAGVVVLCATSSTFIKNDICDLQSDSIDKPYRPIVAGNLKIQTARTFSNALLTLACTISIICWLFETRWKLLLLYIALCFAYNRIKYIFSKIKGFYVALCLAFPLFFGLEIGSLKNLRTTIIAIAFCIYIAHREILLDIRDIKGDSLKGVQTIAVKYGADAAENMSWLLWSISVYLICMCANYDIISLMCVLSYMYSSGLSLYLHKYIKYRRFASTLFQWFPMVFLGVIMFR